MEQFIKDIVAYDQQTREKVDLEQKQLQAFSSELKKDIKALYDTYVQAEEKQLSELENKRKEEYEAYVQQQKMKHQEAIDEYASLSQTCDQYAQDLRNRILSFLKEG